MVATESRRFFTRARQVLLRDAGEEEWSRSVKKCAYYYGWEGYHLRYSMGAIESVHTQWIDGYSEAYGIPDWLYWHEGLNQHFLAELKGAGGRLSPEQKRELPSMRKGGFTVFEWYPRDMDDVEHVFRYGLAA